MNTIYSRSKTSALLLFLSPLIFLFFANSAQAKTVAANSCSNSDVQAAVNSASKGDTVAVPAGSCSWSSTVTISTGVILQGAGIGQTNVTDTESGGAALAVNCSSTNFTRVTGFTFIASADSVNGIVQFSGPIGSVNSFRFDHNRILQNVANGQRGVGGTGVYGLIDNNTFDITVASGSIQQIAFFGSDDGSDGGFTPWTLPTTLGSVNAVYIEDNTFNNGSNVDEDVIDGYGGVRYVIRHNFFNGKGIGFHGTDSGNRRSLHSAEIYNNQFTKTTGSATCMPSGSAAVLASYSTIPRPGQLETLSSGVTGLALGRLVLAILPCGDRPTEQSGKLDQLVSLRMPVEHVARTAASNFARGTAT